MSGGGQLVGGKGRVNGGEIHVVLSLALKMCAEQDTGVLLRSRRRQRTEFF